MTQPANADRHLLFGLLALQNGLVTRKQLVSAFAKWTSDKSTSLDEILVATGALDETMCATLRQLVKLHVQRHGGDAQHSLKSLSGSDLSEATEELAQLDDSELYRSMAAVLDRDRAETEVRSVGLATSRGRFRILKPLPGARGGMGEISVAIDEELGRQVALKQILTGKADQAAYRQKFQVEAEVTGNLEHPGIVPIYGLGAAADGRPYYAMRLVHGDNLNAKIKQFHDASEAGVVDYNSVEFHGLVDRLIDVAQAIRYAHSRGVLHRDLKPGNILVGEYGETLVIDWGLARLPQTEDQATETASSDQSLDAKAPLHIRSGSHVDATIQGQALGTIGYAPPEQLNGQIDQITERSDVYGLGAILYQILVGHTAINSEGSDGDLDELIKNTVEGKFTPPVILQRSVPKALSAVCMKALQREPADRYESVEAFIAEIERWQADQPVTAAPDSIADRVMRMARRYRAAALATAAALLGIAVVAAVALVVVNRARVNEMVARKEAQHSATLARQAEQGAKVEAETATQVSDFLVGLFDVSAPTSVEAAKMTVRDVLDQGAERISRDLAAQPAVQAKMMDVMGRVYGALQVTDASEKMTTEAMELRKQLYGEEHLEIAESLHSMGALKAMLGEFDTAESYYRQALEMRQKLIAEDHPSIAGTIEGIASMKRQKGEFDESEKYFRESLAMLERIHGENHPAVAKATHGVAMIVWASAQHPPEETEAMYRLALQRYQKLYGDEHLATADCMSDLAVMLKNREAYEEAEPLLSK